MMNNSFPVGDSADRLGPRGFSAALLSGDRWPLGCCFEDTIHTFWAVQCMVLMADRGLSLAVWLSLAYSFPQFL